MKLLTLECIAFGRFTDCLLDFSDPGQAFHLIYGANEAGKSTTMRALMGLLYGIPVRTGDAFLHEMKNLRVAGTIERADGVRFSFVRRKGKGDTILDGADGRPVPDGYLAEFLGGMSEDAFDTMFRLDHGALVRGGDDLLAGKGDVAQSLFEAGTGITGLRDILAALDEEADRLFRPRSSTAAINHWTDIYGKARARIREMSIPPREWLDREAALASHEKELRALTLRLSGLREQEERLRRFALALPHGGERSDILTELEEMGRVADLPESAPREREGALRVSEESARTMEEGRARLESLRREIAGLVIPRKVLDRAASITAIYERLDSYRSAARDLPTVRAEKKVLEGEALSLLSEIEPGLTIEGAERLRLTVAEQTRIRNLANRYQKLAERLRGLKERAETTAYRLQEKKPALDAAHAPLDISELQRAVEHARKQGDLEAVLRKETGLLMTGEKESLAALGRLPLWTGTPDELEKLPVPSTETIDLFEAAFTSLTGKQALTDARVEENSQKEGGIDKEIEALRIGGAPPTEDDLHHARSRREKGWHLIRNAWQEGVRSPEEEKAFDAALPLAEGFEKAVAHADTTADRLRREADRVARLAGLLADKENCRRLAAALEARENKIKAELATLQDKWHVTWREAAITPASPKEMRGWLGRHGELLGQIRAVRERRQSIRAMEDAIAIHRDELARALRSLGVEPGLPEERLSAVIDRAALIVKRTVDAALGRATLEKEVQILAAQHDEAIRTLEKTSREMAAWEGDWKAALSPLGFHAGTTVEEATAVLDRLETIFLKIRDSINHGERVLLMEGHISRFTHDVSEAVADLAPDLADLPPDQAAVRLQNLVTAAERETVRREAIEAGIRKEEKALRTASRTSAEAEEKLRALMERAGCTDLANLEAEEGKSARSRELMSRLADVNRTLAGLTAGAPLQSMLDEMAGIHPDRIAFEIEELHREIQDLEQDRSALNQKIGSERAALAAIDGSDGAASAAEEAQNALAAVRDHTDRYLRLRLAAGILRRHIERYREENQDPVITQAGTIFSRLTRGSFSSLKTSFDEKDRPILVGVRPSGEEVEVTGMSDGTRDQLFLALRIAGLERQLGAGEPLPFVLDDTLINFDDPRAEAALSELAALSQKTQILFFTHHARLIELARKAIPAEILKVHDLEAENRAG